MLSPSLTPDFPVTVEDEAETTQSISTSPPLWKLLENTDASSCSSSHAHARDAETLSHDEAETVSDFVENLDGVARAMVHGSFEIRVSDLRIRGLLAQASISESKSERLSVQCIHKTIECLRQVLSLTPEGHAERFDRLAKLGVALARRFEYLGDLADIEEGIKCLRIALRLGPDSHEVKSLLLNDLGLLYRFRFNRLGDVADGEHAIECLSQTVLLTPNGHPDKPNRLGNLGTLYSEQFARLGDLADEEHAIKCLSRAMMLTPDCHVCTPVFSNFGALCLQRFERLGELADVDRAIECLSQVVLLTPDGHKSKLGRLNNLGMSYLRRFQHLGELEDLDKAIECLTQVVMLTPDGRAHKPRYLQNLGMSYFSRFERLGELTDVYKSIECQTQAVLFTPDDDPAKPSCLNNLGSSYESQFRRLGQLEDIDEAITYITQAVMLIPNDHAEKSGMLSNLGGSYLARFMYLGEISDVDKSIECNTQAVRLAPDRHAWKPGLLNNLGSSYQSRFDCLGELSDVDKSIECHIQALLLTPNDHEGKPRRLASLGCAYQSRFLRLREVEDMNKAIGSHAQAVQLAPDGHVEKPGFLRDLGNSYRYRFENLGWPSDADKSIECHTQAVRLTPDDHAQILGRLNNLGDAYGSRFQVLGQLTDLECARSCFQRTAQHIVTQPDLQIRCARKWAKTSIRLQLSPQLAYEKCMRLIPQLIWVGTTINQRYGLLTTVSDLATEAAAWAVSAQSYDLAIEWLEEGRSVVWNQILRLRTPFDDPATVNPPLAHHLKVTASQLEAAGSRLPSEPSLASTSANPEKDAQNHHRLAIHWEDLLGQARSIPGFHNFLQPRKAEELKRAATDGPVILVNTHSTRCDALIIFPECDTVVHIPLENLLLDKLGQTTTLIGSLVGQPRNRAGGFKFKHSRQALKSEDVFRTILGTLWADVVQPILDTIACTNKLPVDELPHITWCTTGALSFLPLHAAGCFNDSQPNAFDLIISSYTPTLSALLTPSVPAFHSSPGMLAVGQADTRGFSPLPNTIQELAAVKEHAKVARFQQLEGRYATVDAVLSAMDEYSWVHLACHATQDPTNPAHSASHLHDGNLTLEAITQRSFKNKGLAFLSACQTATGDTRLPDEAVHLAAGMLMAGYPSVIATMWSISDVDGPEVAGRVYAELLKGGVMDHKEAARALHKAIAQLREKIGVDAFERWVPFIHIGA